jgi:putative FmdB family regulatory protein
VPTYQYRCTDCGEQLEVVQRFDEAALTQCPQCDGRLRKLFGSVGVVFKGSGFYRTDSRGDAKSGASDGSTATKDAGSGDGKGSAPTTASPASPAPAPSSKPAAAAAK